MHRTHLRKVGGSVMLAVPPALLEVLQLQAGASVGLRVEQGKLIIEPNRPRYTLEDLLAQCDHSAEPDAFEREWLDSEAKGDELL